MAITYESHQKENADVSKIRGSIKDLTEYELQGTGIP